MFMLLLKPLRSLFFFSFLKTVAYVFVLVLILGIDFKQLQIKNVDRRQTSFKDPVKILVPILYQAGKDDISLRKAM